MQYAAILFPNSAAGKKVTALTQVNRPLITAVSVSESFPQASTSLSSERQTTTKSDNEKLQLEQAAERLVPKDRKEVVDVSSKTKEYITKMNELIKDSDNTNYDITSISNEVLCALNQDTNPFKQFPWDTQQNIFCEIIKFGINHTPFLIKLIGTLMKTDASFNEKSLYKISFIYSLLVCSANPSRNSSFFKLMTLMLKKSGCTGKLDF